MNNWWSLDEKTCLLWMSRDNLNFKHFYLLLCGINPDKYLFIRKIYKDLPSGLYSNNDDFDWLFDEECKRNPDFKNLRELLDSLKHTEKLRDMAIVDGATDIALLSFNFPVFIWDREPVPGMRLDDRSPKEWLVLLSKSGNEIPSWLTGTDGSPIKKIDKQIEKILEILKEKNINPDDIPVEMKKEIKGICVDQHSKLFTESSFNKAWKQASSSDQISISGKEKYSK